MRGFDGVLRIIMACSTTFFCFSVAANDFVVKPIHTIPVYTQALVVKLRLGVIIAITVNI